MNALLVVDIQNDFLAGGALAVPDGDKVIPIANRLVECFDLILATQDWHPANHGSFATNHPNRHPGEIIDLNGTMQVLWPVHCVQGSPGAEFSAQLRTDRFAHVFRKGTDPGIEDACRGVNLKPDDSTTAIGEMRKAGAFIIDSAELGR